MPSQQTVRVLQLSSPVGSGVTTGGSVTTGVLVGVVVVVSVQGGAVGLRDVLHTS